MKVSKMDTGSFFSVKSAWLCGETHGSYPPEGVLSTQWASLPLLCHVWHKIQLAFQWALRFPDLLTTRCQISGCVTSHSQQDYTLDSSLSTFKEDFLMLNRIINLNKAWSPCDCYYCHDYTIIPNKDKNIYIIKWRILYVISQTLSAWNYTSIV